MSSAPAALGMRPLGLGAGRGARVARGRALVVGAGGLGSPALRVLARSGVGTLVVLDDDRVEEGNLHRQVLFGPADVGRPKVEVARERLGRIAASRGVEITVEAREGRLTPDTAAGHLRGVDVLVEGADNLPTKFLAADAAQLAGVPVVHAGVVRWGGWALATLPGRSACLRCVFEGVPADPVDDCATAGVVGPVVGVLGALQAALALRILADDAGAGGVLWSYDGLAGRLRPARVARRAGCALCGPGRSIAEVRPDLYAPGGGAPGPAPTPGPRQES